MSLIKIMVSLGLLCFSTLESLSSLSAQNFEEFRRQVEELGELTEPPKTYVAEGFESDAQLSAIFYEGLSWQGRQLGFSRGSVFLPKPMQRLSLRMPRTGFPQLFSSMAAEAPRSRNG